MRETKALPISCPFTKGWHYRESPGNQLWISLLDGSASSARAQSLHFSTHPHPPAAHAALPPTHLTFPLGWYLFCFSLPQVQYCHPPPLLLLMKTSLRKERQKEWWFQTGRSSVLVLILPMEETKSQTMK